MIVRPEGGWKMERVTTHPGEMLLEDFLKPLEMPVEELASRLHIAADLTQSIVDEREPVTPDIALRLEVFFGMSAQFWLNMPIFHELTKAQLGSGQRLHEEIQPYQKAA